MGGFVIQRFHPLIRPGLHLGAAGSKIAVHSQQSRWDAACTCHCVAMALRIAGLITDPSQIATRKRRIESMLWRKTTEVFAKGMTFSELVVFVADLDCGLWTKLLEHSSHREAIPWIEHELARGRLVICSVRAVGDRQNHAVLATGVEGVQRDRRFEAHALLILDPAEGPPAAFAPCNARLQYRHGTSDTLPRYAKYTTAVDAFSAVLTGAVAIDVAEVQTLPQRRPP
ncbi:hypothetical protein CY652_06895 [Burkholderia sp. WAC0059]|uniref:hypothetical protein n=1 Tax=Burkholderia sp. WAC0059 TaxID=2066022 RepID=UPI000C7F69FD|nr:hypothetical protein [Burkholderia sp. WAC0059]PLZ03034.1 hypothetical protein CY652_06895 [Burkholderia sp. WAC0059]